VLESLMARLRRPSGFTLLEMMVALAIVALLLTLTLPSFGSILSRYRLKSAAEQLSTDLGELRFLSAQRGVPLHLHVHAGVPWCYALATTSGCDCRIAQSCQLKTVNGQDHPGVSLVEGHPLLVDGRSASPGGVLFQSSDGARLRVSMTPLGRARVCAPGEAISGVPAC
jgi:type IV fimbrial biogenesis protein FimT